MRSHRIIPMMMVLAFTFYATELNAQNVNLEVGSPAPSFEAPAADGSTWKSGDHYGKKIVVVYFYPAAMTGGCTKQACSFRDDRAKLAQLGAEVVGISGDVPGTLQLFQKAHALTFSLLSDETGAVAKKFGVPVRDGGVYKAEIEGKEVTLKRPVTLERWTFIVDKDGKIIYKNTAVDAVNDSKNVITAIEQAQARS